MEREAALSGDEHSSDESEDSDYDQMDNSFINDATQLSQAVEHGKAVQSKHLPLMSFEVNNLTKSVVVVHRNHL